MPNLIPSKKFLSDIDTFQSDGPLRKKLAKALNFLASNPQHPGLNIERIINDPTAWSIRIDRRYRIAFEPKKYLPSGNPDWSGDILLLRCLDHDDLYKSPR
jgi:hypothetical protein